MYSVLLAEDEELILEGLKDLIDWERLGLRIIHSARDGQEALKLWKKEPADIVVTDIDMPRLSGLDFISQVRELDERARFIILTGYDEFEYAKKAIPLDVEDYILKPIDEDQLEETLVRAMEKLREQDNPFHFFHYLSGNILEGDPVTRLVKYGLRENFKEIVLGKIIWEKKKTDGNSLYLYLKEEYKKEEIQFFYEGKEEIIVLKYLEKEESPSDYMEYFMNMQNHMESKMEASTFFAVSRPGKDLLSLPVLYKEVKKLQKYLLIEGYGACVWEEYVKDRKCRDIAIDEEQFRKLILSRDQNKASGYLEDLFLNNLKKGSTVEDIYKLSLKISLLLSRIMEEFHLDEIRKKNNMTDLIEQIDKVEDLSMLKGIFIALTAQIMEEVHTENSAYTPVVRQVLKEIENDYRQDMNLKTLAYKYKINTSYLGQIFQKEVGVSFAHYVNNLRNAKARELILNTNMKINDIAKELGYEEPSYFYRKFKQCYGVSPASLRELKK